MSRSKQPDSKQDRQWAEAKRRCRLNREDIRMARELGLKPRSLIKNIPAPNQQWKMPVKQWLHELFEGKVEKPPVKRLRSLPHKHSEPANDLTPPHTCVNEPVLTPAQAHAPPDEIMADWEAYADELRDDDDPLRLPEYRMYRKIREENRRTQKRYEDFCRAAQYLARAFGQIAGVEKVVLFGSVAQPLREERPRYRKYRRAGMPMLHEPRDIDLAVWVSDPGCLQAMQKVRSRAVSRLFKEQAIGIAHHKVDVFIMEPGSDRYLGRLCTYTVCPKGKPECRVPGCGHTALLQQHEDFELSATALAPDRSITSSEHATETRPGCAKDALISSYHGDSQGLASSRFYYPQSLLSR